MTEFLKRHNISIQLALLILSLWFFSYYNYVSQKALFLNQLQSDSSDLLRSVRSSINKFNSIEQTLSLQALVSRISFELDIFEFRYLDGNGVVVSSIFEEEVGKPYSHAGDAQPPADKADASPSPSMGQFYMEERDLTNVMAITFPVREDGRLYGFIDLAIDVTEFDYIPAASHDVVLYRLQMDTKNLLNAVAGSIISRIKVFETLDLPDFLSSLVAQTGGVLEVSLADQHGHIYSSSRAPQAAEQAVVLAPINGTIRRRGDGRYEYLIHAPLEPQSRPGETVLISVDASVYAANERKLFYTSVATSLLAILVSVTIAYAIYRINLRRAREENVRLEQMVAERTQELKRISQTDKLTGLANRTHLEEQLDMEYKRAQRYHFPLSLAVVDLDFFKLVNDTHGHLAGDAVLREIGTRLRVELRETDFVGRFGGEEFVVILTNTNLHGSLKLAEIMRRLVEETPVHFEEKDLQVTASIGVAQLQPMHDSYKALFADADKALYLAKEVGRNCVTYAEDGEVKRFVDRRITDA